MINYIEAINEPGGIPDVKSAWSNIQTLESKNLIKQVKEGNKLATLFVASFYIPSFTCLIKFFDSSVWILDHADLTSGIPPGSLMASI
jgi:hypothetical protein